MCVLLRNCYKFQNCLSRSGLSTTRRVRPNVLFVAIELFIQVVLDLSCVISFYDCRVELFRFKSFSIQFIQAFFGFKLF